MQLSRFDYYSDYVVYPALILASTAVEIAGSGRHDAPAWCVAAAIGFATWTFAEYWVHRLVLHRMPYFSPMHAEHHAAPLAWIGTPTWISLLTLGVVVLVPAWALLGFTRGSGLFTGVIGGYVWYGAVHHRIHHPPVGPGLDVPRTLRAHHLRHHYRPQAGNFGVTTVLWDHVFRTALRTSRP